MAVMDVPARRQADEIRALLAWSTADRLRKIRREIMHLEQRTFAEMLGVSKETYTAWETGRNEPKSPVAVARRIEVLTGVPAAWVLGVDQPLTGSNDTPQRSRDMSRDMDTYQERNCDVDFSLDARRVARLTGASPVRATVCG